MKKLLVIYLVSFGAFASVNSKAQVEIVEDIFSKAKKTDFAKDRSAQNFVTSKFNYSIMANKILGDQLKKLKETDISWFRNQIKEIVTRTVYPKATDFLNNVKLEHEVLSKKKNTFSVLTVVKKRGEESEVVSKLEKHGGSWKIVDISIDDESWTENIKEQVQKVIKKRQWAGLKKSLTNRLNDIKSGKSTKKKLDEE